MKRKIDYIRSHTTRGWLLGPCTGIASLPMTYFCFFVIANPVCWLWQGVKRSPTRGTRTGSIRSHTRGGQLRNPPTNYASLAVTIIFAVFVIPTPSIFVKMVPLAMTIFFFRRREPGGLALATREAIPLVKRKMACAQNTTRRGQLRNPPIGHASLAGTTACP